MSDKLFSRDRLLISGLASEYEAAFFVDLSNGNASLITDDARLSAAIGECVDFTRAHRAFANRFVHSEDRERFESEIYTVQGVKRLMNVGSRRTFEYRSNETGEYIWHRAMFNRIGENELLVCYKKCNEEVITRHISRKFIEEFASIFIVDIKNDTYRFMSRNAESGFKDVPGGVYSDTISEYATRVNPDYRAKWEEFADTERVKQLLTAQNRIEYVYPLEGVKKRWRRCILQVLETENGCPLSFIMTYITVEGSRTAELELAAQLAKQNERLEQAKQNELTQQALIKQNAEIITGLTGEYVALYYINFEQNLFKVYAVDEERIADTKRLLSQFSEPFELIAKFAASPAVHPDDKQLFANFNVQTVRERLSGGKRFSVRFRRDYGRGFLWSIMEVIKCEDKNDEANAIIIGFAERDKEIRMEMEAEQARDTARLMAGIISSYSTAYAVNILTDSYRAVKYNEEYKEKYRNDKFSVAFESYICGEVYPADQELLRSELDYARMAERLKTQDNYELEFRTLEKGLSLWHELRVTKAGGNGEVLISIQTRDKEILYKHIQSIMTERFEGIYISDFTNYTMKILKGTGGFKQFEGKLIPWQATMQKFSENLIGEDKLFFRDVYGNPEAIKQVLIKDKDIEYYYRSPNYGGELVWMKSEVHTLTWDKYGNPETAMVGISQIDSQQREKMRMNEMIASQKLQLEEQQKQLQEALSMAQSASRAKTTFLNNMSHDIRTPMNAIIGYTGLAASHIDNKEQVRDYLSKIGQSSDHLLSLINDVLDMSRIESGKMHIEEKEENLPDIIHTLRDIVQADIHAKSLDFFVDAVDIRNEEVMCDKLRLNQVLLNVLSNAIKYTPAGGTVSLRVIQKTVKPNGYATYEFRVKDNGIGMEKQFLTTIFDPFTRVKSSTVSGIQGTGLGMAITKNIIDMAGGEIEIESEPNVGTEVIIRVDMLLCGEARKEIKIDELSGLRALVVDDDANTCISVSNMVREVGMRDEWCTSGHEAIIRAQEAYRRGDSFKVYIIDWLMPDMNGIETTRRIRRVIGRETPKIILTSYDWSDIEEEAREAGVTAFVSKPMFPSDLHRVLADCIGREKQPECPVKAFEFEGKRILLVDDNELNREIAAEILGEAGFEVDTAEDGDIAVDKIKNARRRDYDIVLMDIQMPTLDGYAATRQIRASGGENADIPIIAMTANAFEEDRIMALEAGMNDHIAKPINITRLKETLSKFL